jgi:isopenicillin N synthase-like dioxygenase
MKLLSFLVSMTSPFVLVITVVAAASEPIFQQEVVSVSYADLQAFAEGNVCPEQHALLSKTIIANAFGPHGLGFLEVTDIPEDMVVLRRTVLEVAPQLAALPADELDAITLPETLYTIGWSHGKEQFQTNGPYDTAKGSFYVDPFRPDRNVFPNSLPNARLQDPLLRMTHFMAKVGLWIAQLIDAYLENNTTTNNSNNNLVYQSLETCTNAKARLLYYFPPKEQQGSSSTTTIPTTTTTTATTTTTSLDDWCGWHKDHGSLTALLPGMLFGDNVDPKAGLYIQTTTPQTNGKSGEEEEEKEEKKENVHIQLPSTSLGFQLGETVELMSGGRLRATPHAVTAGTSTGGRSSLAVFLQPEADQVLPQCPSSSSTVDESLISRWRPTFGAFQQATTQAFH